MVTVSEDVNDGVAVIGTITRKAVQELKAEKENLETMTPLR